jgi:hypothetical protein
MDRTMLHFPCPHCRKSLKARPVDAGRRARCTGCGKTVNVPPDEATDYTAPAQLVLADPAADFPPDTTPWQPHFLAEPAMTTPQPSFVQKFLIVTALIATGAVVLLVLYALLASDYDVRQATGWTKSFAVGFPIGAWFSFMVNLVVAYALADIARTLKHRA